MSDTPSTFDDLLKAGASAPEGYALYEKATARQYIKARNDFIAFVASTIIRTDMSDAAKIMTIKMHPGRNLR